MRYIPIIARILLGFVFFGSGLAGLLNLIPPPANLPEKLQTFMAGLMATTYFFPLLKGTETICGLLLMTGAFVPLALVVLAPITLNILLTHAFLAPDGLILALVMLVLHLYLALCASPYKEHILPLFRARMRESWKK
jgi:uncharacterized membrane protein YphA (DoxX/SURF4 family)